MQAVELATGQCMVKQCMMGVIHDGRTVYDMVHHHASKQNSSICIVINCRAQAASIEWQPGWVLGGDMGGQASFSSLPKAARSLIWSRWLTRR